MGIYHSYTDERRLRAAQYDIAQREGLVGDDTETPDGTRVVGVVPSLCENEMYPWDRSVIKALRTLDPWLVPVAVKYICRTAAHTDFTVFRHGIARMPRPVQEGLHEDYVMNVILPSSPGAVNVNARHPMIWLNILHRDPDATWNLPTVIGGPYMPLDWRVFYNSREETRTPTQEATDIARARADNNVKMEAAAKSKHDDKWDEEFPEIDRNLRRMDVTDVKNLHQPIEQEKKPFVDMRGAA